MIKIYILIVFIISIYTLNYIFIKRTNDSYEIIQKYKPDRNQIVNLVNNKSPLVLLGIIEDWFIYDENDKIDHKKLTKDVLNDNTRILNNVLTIKKSYIINFYKNNQSKLIQENNVRHFLCLLEGNISVYLFNPKQNIEYDINNGIKESKYSFWNEEKEKLKDTNFIEIKLDKEQILYIPYGWWYCFKSNEESLILDINSNTILTAPLSLIL
uniref:Uncharacterized protein n=1 Tax=Mimiviridae sp. ChoanoV1 TaxID=2596887 RepID=A0A5B8HV21_9VIRU|nr:hypothetical protein 1_214 [Mimiviridae sp. ChoanoV1]